MRAKTALVFLSAMGAAAAAVGCSAGKPTENTDTSEATLVRVQSCSELESYLKADAAYRMNRQIDRQIESIRVGWGYGYSSGSRESAPMSAGSATDSKGASPAPSSGPTSSGASDFSTTNTQVKGVDEADFVKTDGKYIYLLHGQELKIINAWPTASMAVEGSAKIEGAPTEMFVADGKVVVFSQTNGYSLFGAAGVKPHAVESDGGDSDDRPSTAVPGGGGGGPSPDPYVPVTKVTILNLVGTTATVAREAYFEGGYKTSRRVNAHVRAVLQGGHHGPSLPTWVSKPSAKIMYTSSGITEESKAIMIGDLEALRSKNLAKLAAAKYADWLPFEFERTGAKVTASLPSCSGFYVPTVGSTTWGMTTVAALEMTGTAAPKTSSILGQADVVYGSTDALYLSGHAYVDMPMWGWGGGVVSSGTAEVGPSTPPSAGSGSVGTRTVPVKPPPFAWKSLTRSHIHKFDFKADPTFPSYLGSGSVDGTVLNQFSMDEHNGNLRVATSTQFTNGSEWKQNNRLTVLGQSGYKLAKVGSIPSLAEGERIYSARFMGGKGYIVTFRQVDPLFSLDLTNPAAPVVTGELKIPGFSEYMHPIGPNHLLTIGRDTKTDPVTGRTTTNGLALQIFDVTNPTAPALAHKFVYSPASYGYSEAESNHKAFTWFAERNLLAFPYYSSGAGGTKSGLEIFRVNTATGFQRLGAIDHSPLVKTPSGFCGYWDPAVRRGIFLENIAYAVSYGGIVAKDVNDLGSPGTTLSLPVPSFYYPYGYGGPACAPGG